MHEVDRVMLLNIFLRKYISIVIQFKTLFLMEKGQAVVQCNQNKMIKSVRDYCVFFRYTFKSHCRLFLTS